LRYVFEKTRKIVPPPRYLLDMDQCTSLDSTFMGTMASMALHQRKTTGTPIVVVNIQPHVRYLLETLGLNFILEMRLPPAGGPQASVPSSVFRPAHGPELTPMERIAMMIEAHEKLVDVDSQNEVKFEGVLKSLRDSLDRVQQDKPE
jgi:hypothetical protein